MIKLKQKVFGSNQVGVASLVSGTAYHISANDPLSYDGTNIIKDLSGNSRNGTIYSNPIKIGNILQFDGVDDYIDMGNIMNIGTGEISYTTWLKASQSVFPGWIGKSVYGATYGRYSLGNNGNPYFYAELPTAIITNYILTIDFSKVNSITHIIKRDKQELYVNGILLKTLGHDNLGSTNVNPDIKFFIAAYGNNQGNKPQSGLFKNMQFGESFGYQRALTATEVLQNYNTLKDKYL